MSVFVLISFHAAKTPPKKIIPNTKINIFSDRSRNRLFVFSIFVLKLALDFKIENNRKQILGN